MSAEWDDLRLSDRPMCFRFGSGAFPCGEPFKVRVTRSNAVGRRSGIITRRVVCEKHYNQAVGTVNYGSAKLAAKNDAFVRLAAAYPEEFQRLYADALERQGLSVTGEAVAS